MEDISQVEPRCRIVPAGMSNTSLLYYVADLLQVPWPEPHTSPSVQVENQSHRTFHLHVPDP